ncbi:MAG: type II 3-dehydroquinate dehydratase [Flavobacteriales bacterium]|nr:type II 3-dehydroquinate dehydratase [Flavobacteriales bacterium]
MKVIIINGPNLNLLGVRQPEIYGHETFDGFLESLRKSYPDIQLDYFQSNSEGELIDKLQSVGFSYEGIILNPAGYSHTSVALADCVAAISTPVVEVHISNIYAREEFRRHSYISPYCKAVISGLGLMGYESALRFLIG